MTTEQANQSEPQPGQHDEPTLGFTGDDAETAKLREQLAQAQGDYQRVLADFSNYQRRALINEQVAKTDGSVKVTSDVVSIVDHFDLALNQDLAKTSPQALLDGMKIIRDELLRTLARHGVTVVAPKPNDVFQPGRHEAIMQQAAEGVEPGHVVATFQSGYAIATASGERVIRPAKVSVAPTP